MRFLGQDDPPEKEMEIHSSILAWRNPKTEEPGRLQAMGVARVRHDLVTKPPPPYIYPQAFELPSLSGGEGNGSPLQCSCLENPVDRGAWWAAVYGVTQSRTQLKQLSMHACIGEGNGNPLQCSCLENPRDRGAWWAAVCGVAESDTTEAT